MMILFSTAFKDQLTLRFVSIFDMCLLKFEDEGSAVIFVQKKSLKLDIFLDLKSPYCRQTLFVD